MIANPGICPKCTTLNPKDNKQCVPDPSYWSCMTGVCDWMSQYLDPFGACKPCPVCQMADTTHTKCIKNTSYDLCMYNACDWTSMFISQTTGQCTYCDVCEVPNIWSNGCFQPADYATCKTNNPTPVVVAAPAKSPGSSGSN